MIILACVSLHNLALSSWNPAPEIINFKETDNAIYTTGGRHSSSVMSHRDIFALER